MAMVFVVNDFVSRRIDPSRRGAPMCRHNDIANRLFPCIAAKLRGSAGALRIRQRLYQSRLARRRPARCFRQASATKAPVYGN
jgi:hypothetical protein